MSNHEPVNQMAVDNFFGYVQQRRVLMAAGGTAAIAVGVVGAVLVGSGAGVGWLVGLAIVGAAIVLGSRAGAPLLREARMLVPGPSAKMELTTWPYRTIRSPVNNRVLVTIDIPGSVDRTPLAEFKPVWYTPGTANHPTRAAEVYGAIGKGRTVLAVAEDGSCYVGRIRRIRSTG
jgi:hypothetical protein